MGFASFARGHQNPSFRRFPGAWQRSGKAEGRGSSPRAGSGAGEKAAINGNFRAGHMGAGGAKAFGNGIAKPVCGASDDASQGIQSLQG
ncbi:MAG: hypothetical protein AAFW83_03530 [Pseudomonadota bacterium]